MFIPQEINAATAVCYDIDAPTDHVLVLTDIERENPAVIQSTAATSTKGWKPKDGEAIQWVSDQLDKWLISADSEADNWLQLLTEQAQNLIKATPHILVAQRRKRAVLPPEPPGLAQL